MKEIFENYQELETVTLYRFMKFCDMSKRVKCPENRDIKATIWRSKLNYLFSRNLDMEKDSTLMEVIVRQIEANPSSTKLFLSEFLYKRRRVGNEKKID